MGYQESWGTVKPAARFRKLVLLCAALKAKGYYDDPTTVEPLSVVVLKQDIGKYPAGTTLLWVVGDRCFHHAANLTDSRSPRWMKLSFQGIEDALGLFRKELQHNSIFGFDEDRAQLYFDGLQMMDDQPSENDFMKRYPFAFYAKMMQKQQERGR